LEALKEQFLEAYQIQLYKNPKFQFWSLNNMFR
jgi:hypothetical protein